MTGGKRQEAASASPGGSRRLAEWRGYWTLPLAAALGHSTGVLHVYSLGAFMEPLQQEFAWSRAHISSGITVVGLTGALLSVPVGALVDRVGPRIIGLTSAALMTATFAMLGMANGGAGNWLLLWILVALGNLGLQATVLVTAVSRRFEASRGLAFAITLSGASLGAMVFPLLATWLIEVFGWRHAFAALGGIWAAIVVPVMLLYFRVPSASQAHEGRSGPAPSLPGLSIAEGLRSPAFYKLAAVSGLFTLTSLGVIVHFVPILAEAGAEPLTAAKIAAIVGVSSLIGRIGTGVLLDRLPGRMVGGSILLLPILGGALLLFAGTAPAAQLMGALCFGITLGAEVDVVAYLATRHFGMRNYGMLFGFINACLASGVAVGPVLAGAIYDSTGDYGPFLMLTMGLMALGSAALFSLPNAPHFGEGTG